MNLRTAAAWLRRTPLHPQWLLETPISVRVLGELSGVVLDIGCGNRWVQRALPLDAEYIGIDYPATGNVLYGSRPDIFATAEFLPVADQSADVVVCLEVIEHVRDHPRALAEFARVLKKEGRLLMTVPFMYPVHDAPHDFQRLTRFGLARDLQAAGFADIHVEEVGHAVRAAALLLSISLVGGMRQRKKAVYLLLIPFAGAAVLLINLAAAIASYVLPAWSPLCTNYRVFARR